MEFGFKVGQILDAINDAGIGENTIIFSPAIMGLPTARLWV